MSVHGHDNDMHAVTVMSRFPGFHVAKRKDAAGVAAQPVHMKALDFIHNLSWEDLPGPVRARSKLCLRDLLGIAAGGYGTKLARIARDHACEDMPGQTPILFETRRASAPAAAMAMGMGIDSLDGHDGYNPSKGHVGAPLLPALLALLPPQTSGAAFLTCLVMGYEFGSRCAEAQHSSVPDYHTSGSWGALAGAAAGARLLGLTRQQTRHALGIAEYHGPRSQMMRCIDHPTMLKDGAGWGALCGVSAVLMARRGFTGAPALIIENVAEPWGDLGTDWRILKQYFKPWPICRWAQAPVAAALDLRNQHGINPNQIRTIKVETFHESCRLATARPRTTEEAQYSTSFPVAVALMRGTLGPEDLDGAALSDPQILRLSNAMQMHESDKANAAFPLKRLARVTLDLMDGHSVTSDWHEPPWDWDAPPTAQELCAKYDSFAQPALGPSRALAISEAIDWLDDGPLSALTDLLYCAK